MPRNQFSPILYCAFKLVIIITIHLETKQISIPAFLKKACKFNGICKAKIVSIHLCMYALEKQHTTMKVYSSSIYTTQILEGLCMRRSSMEFCFVLFSFFPCFFMFNVWLTSFFQIFHSSFITSLMRIAVH